ncbi:F-box protein CPR1-like [Nicotiana tabacum]|uniref:F-box protein CPR1-like n=1 Tax=Nicotiana tabacum TaxID=4097 RepID=A0A1S3YYJ0_TOBAC|nr:F-box protein CPR1-like [Nicotiana tomentosiformis]XP_016457150.1 PREDICTED: F-box protein CPR30-like [Nicotiana tabacum]
MEIHIQKDEILIDILTRLPVKSLVRFKCVSESWNTLISEPYFKKKHLNHAKYQPNSQKLLFSQWSPKDKVFDFYCYSLSLVQLVKDIRKFDWPSSCNPADGIKVYCCCDGLFLIGIWSNRDLAQPSIILVWNPSTGESIVLPHSENSTSDDYDEKTIYGLGYDSTSDDYKVLRIDMCWYDKQILALKSGSWRKIDKTLGRTNISLLSTMECLTHVHGALHWLGWLSKLFVVSFNISNEMFREIQLPEMMCLLPLNKIIVDVDVGLSVSGGMLCVYYNKITFNLWVIKDYGVNESWTKVLAIPNNEIYRIMPIYRFSDDEVLLNYRDWRTLTRIEYRIISDGLLGLSNRIWPLDCNDIDVVTIDHKSTFQSVYTESLISPKLGH